MTRALGRELGGDLDSICISSIELQDNLDPDSLSPTSCLFKWYAVQNRDYPSMLNARHAMCALVQCTAEWSSDFG